MVLILDWVLQESAQVIRSNLCYLICLSHFIRSWVVKNLIFFQQDLFSFIHAQHFVHLLTSPTSTHSSFHTFINSTIDRLFHSFNQSFSHPFIYLFIQLCINPSIYPAIHSSAVGLRTCTSCLSCCWTGCPPSTPLARRSACCPSFSSSLLPP